MVMGAIGNAKDWKEDLFPYELIPEILELIIGSWKTFKKPGCLDHEVSISRAFTKKLQYEKNRQNSLPFTVLMKTKTIMDGSIFVSIILARQMKKHILLLSVRDYVSPIHTQDNLQQTIVIMSANRA